MSDAPAITLDRRDAAALVRAILARGPGYVPGWRPGAAGADLALVQIAAHYVEAVLRRLNQAPRRSELAFLDLLGVELVPARGARVPLVFTLAENAPDGRLPAGARVAAPPPPGRTDQVVFETERAVGLAAARLVQVVSLWPGRDQYLDHSTDLQARRPFTLFDRDALQDTPHALYLAHDTLLALAGASTVDVDLELPTPSSRPLDLVWEYWDGTTWREFLDMRPECDQLEASRLDGTDGLTHTGRYRLRTECAETSQTTVGGIDGFWVRARLEETLPPGPAHVLPELDVVRLSTEVLRPVNVAWTRGAVTAGTTQRQLAVQVTDEVGTPLRGVPVSVEGAQGTTDLEGSFTAGVGASDASADVRLGMAGVELDATVDLKAGGETQAQFRLLATGLAPDKAFVNSVAVDLSKPFQVLGAQPQAGDAFYFSSAEAFARPGARLTVYVQTAPAPSDQLVPPDPPVISVRAAKRRTAARTRRLATAVALGGAAQQLVHGVSWEYWDGRAWTSLSTFTSSPSGSTPGAAPDDFTATGTVELVVPDDMATTKVAGQDGLWMRVRLTSGGYGFTQTVALQSGGSFVYVVPQPPTVSKLLLGYAWRKGPSPPGHVLAYNDFQYVDRTEEATWPGKTFQPFQPVSDLTPAVYLGYDRPLPVDWLGLYLDIAEVPGDTVGPALTWESWDGGSWRDLTVEDETRALRLPGMVSFIGPDDGAPLARFGVPLHWVRARLVEDGPPGAPAVDGLYPNAVWATQQQTVTDEPIAQSTGAPDQVLAFRQRPILPGQVIAVRELAGARAEVEWRILARELLGDDVIARLEALLGNEVTTADVQLGPLRLVRDRDKKVVEAWVTWAARRDLRASGPHDRHYAVDRARGLLSFGDGAEGKIPPIGAAVLALRYQTGGGQVGNVAAGSVSQLVGPMGGVESATNPVAAEGGADGETLEQLAERGPHRLRARGRALTPQDYEALAREADPAVAIATAVPCLDAAGRRRPGWLTLVITPRSAAPRPWPSFGLREIVRAYVAARADAALAAADRLQVTGPAYQPVDVSATIVPLDPAQAGAIDAAARHALQDFLHPLHGGLDGRGLRSGESIFLSDVAEVLSRVEGVDYVQDLALSVNGALQGAEVAVAPGRVPVAGLIDVRLTEP